jgi:hypothetical protein
MVIIFFITASEESIKNDDVEVFFFHNVCHKITTNGFVVCDGGEF